MRFLESLDEQRGTERDGRTERERKTEKRILIQKYRYRETERQRDA